MDCKKKFSSSPSSSSFTADLFGTKESPPSSSSGIFASIFPPPNKVVGRKSLSSEGMGSWQKQPSSNQGWNTKQGGLGTTGGTQNKDNNSIFVEERVQPCHLSSSLYYGGQDNYTQQPPMLKNDGGEDDPNETNSNSASRGNWWQGSLYY